MKILSAIRLPFVAAAAIVFAGSASATYNHSYNYCPPKKVPTPDECVVKATAYGDSWCNDDFWKIQFKEAVCDDAYIKEICIDLQAGYDANAYFDLSGGNASGGAFGPKIGWLSGLSASDITFSPDNGDSSKLLITFADGAFGVGDYLKFGTDIDSLGDNKGDDVGRKSVGFAVTFGDGSVHQTSFYKTSYKSSKAYVRADDCCGKPITVIPSPSAAGLGLLMLGGIVARRRRSA